MRSSILWHNNFADYLNTSQICPPLKLKQLPLYFTPTAPKVEYAYVGALIAAAVAFYVPFVHFSLRIPGMNKIYRSDVTHKYK